MCVLLLHQVVEMNFALNWYGWLFRGLIGYKYKWYKLKAETNIFVGRIKMES